MKKFLMILASTLLMATASAQTADVSKLTPDQQAAIQKTITEMQSPKNISETARVETEKWVELGGNMGKAAVGAARELGIAANEFVQTPIGRITMAVVVYKVIGQDVIGMIVGLGVLVFFLSLALYFFKAKKYMGVQYEYQPRLFGLYHKQVVTSGTVDSEWSVGYLISGFICLFIGLVVGLNVML